VIPPRLIPNEQRYLFFEKLKKDSSDNAKELLLDYMAYKLNGNPLGIQHFLNEMLNSKLLISSNIMPYDPTDSNKKDDASGKIQNRDRKKTPEGNQ
jgi:hypothetical protein